ncbi:2-hydroxyacid dehydrogenase [Rhodococcus sp. USK13]|uniref:2-hydroxyacid dehydrogenase n=1 Tax=Rhodococcus sp. USK13 TaxID=2806442 RepID=UPI001BD1A81F|nr:2-hydroxyacid dehydrogenase [Rhodococcus sp. USK13]
MKIVVGDRNLLPHKELFERGLPSGASVSWHQRFDEPLIVADLADADVYVGGRFTAAMAAAAPKLRLVHVAGAGTDKVDFDTLPADTVVANTFHHEDSIAEYIVSAAVLLRRGLLHQDRALRGDRWASSVYDDAIPQPASMHDARIGFVGFGHIGRRSWNLLRAFGSSGCAVTGRGGVDAGAEGLVWAGDHSSLLRLMFESDIVVVSAPLNSATRGMIGTAELAALGAGGVVINVGRGPLIREQALYDALATGVIASAAVDVWYADPDPNGRGAPAAHPFRELRNLLMTPHSSGVTRHTFVGRVRDITDNIRRLDAGQTVLRTVRPG